MNKPAFNPDQPFQVADKPPFDPNQPFQASKNEPTGIIDKTKAFISKWTSPTLSIPGVIGGPLSLPTQGQGVINEAFNRVGEKIATGLAEKGFNPAPLGAIPRPIKVNPILSAAAGTAISMTPDIVSSVASPIAEVPIAPNTAVGPARRALGFSKRFLQTPFARREATSAAATALKEGIIPGAGNPDVMMERAQNLRMKTGKALGDIRSSVGKQPIDDVLSGLSKLKEEMTGGATTGIQGKKLAQIQMAEDTLNNLISKGKEVGLNDVIQAKNDIGQTINWLADNATQKTHKGIVKSIEDSVSKILGKSGTDLGVYNGLKKTYGASKSMIKALNNEISAQQGNMGLSLPTHMIAAGKLASGNALGALETAGLWELLKRRGAGITASTLNKARVPTGAAALLLNASRRKQ